MTQNPPKGYSRITPYLLYEDVGAALDWLSQAFGFRERLRFDDPEGNVTHAEMELGNDGVIMMGDPGRDYRSPKRLGQATQYVHVYVDDVDKHFEVANEHSATILSPPEDQSYGDRSYGVEDPEGHRWTFAEHKRDVSQEDW